MRFRSTSFSAVLWAGTVVVIVGSIVGVGWWLGTRQDNPAPTTQTSSAGPPTVTADKDYYLFIRLLEFTPHNPNGKQWDIDSSAPDAEVRLTWRGNRTFALPTRTDQLIASWDLFRVDVGDLITKRDIDISSMINGPIIHVMPNETITVEVVDNDFGPSDQALKMDIPLDRLHEGHNNVTIPPGAGVTRLRIDMLPTSTPLADLIKWQTGPEK